MKFYNVLICICVFLLKVEAKLLYIFEIFNVKLLKIALSFSQTKKKHFLYLLHKAIQHF